MAVGIDVASAGQGFFWCLPYTVAELAGALLAVGALRECRREKGK